MTQQTLQQQPRPHLTPDEYRAYRQFHYINKSKLIGATTNDLQSEFYDISKGITYLAIESKGYRKKLIFSLKNKGYIVASSKKPGVLFNNPQPRLNFRT